MYSQRLSLRYHLFIYRLVHSFFTDICRARWHNSSVLQCFSRAVAARSPAQGLVLLLHLCLVAQSFGSTANCLKVSSVPAAYCSRDTVPSSCVARLSAGPRWSDQGARRAWAVLPAPRARSGAAGPALAARALAHAVPGQRSSPRVLPDAVFLLGSKYKHV